MSGQLLETLAELQSRFGAAAPRPVLPQHAVRPTGCDELDELIGIGGWPVARLSLLGGPRGSGKRTLAQRTLARASQEGPVVYVDAPGRLDPGQLAGLGACLDRVLVVRPRTPAEGMQAALVLARAGADLVCLDLPPQAADLEAEWSRLLHRAVEAECTLLAVQDNDVPDVLRYAASVILQVRRQGWVLNAHGDLKGIEVEAQSVKNRLAPPGRQRRFVLEYPLTEPRAGWPEAL